MNKIVEYTIKYQDGTEFNTNEKEEANKTFTENKEIVSEYKGIVFKCRNWYDMERKINYG